MHELHSNDIAGGHEWAHGEDAAAINTAMDDRGETIGRAIRIGDVTTTGSVLALVRKQGDDPAGKVVTELALAGEKFVLDFYRVGTDTTCEDLTVIY